MLGSGHLAGHMWYYVRGTNDEGSCHYSNDEETVKQKDDDHMGSCIQLMAQNTNRNATH